MAKLTPDEQGLMNMFLDAKVMVVMAVSVLISVFIFAMGVRRVTLSPTRFNLGVVACTVTFLLNDVIYWIVISFNWFPNLFEIVRILSPIIAGGQVAGLCFERFKVFGNTTHARWYTATVRRTLLGINYAIMAVGLGLLTYTFVGLDLSKRIPFHPWRKIIIIASAGFTVLSDFTLTVLIFRIVLQIHQALDPLTSSNGLSGSNQQVPSMTPSSDLRRARRAAQRRYRTVVRKVMLSLVGMLATSMIAMGVYGMSGNVFGHTFAYVWVRLYVVCAMIEWYLVVELVRDRPSGQGGRGGAGYASGTMATGAAASESKLTYSYARGGAVSQAGTDGVMLKPVTAAGLASYGRSGAPRSGAAGGDWTPVANTPTTPTFSAQWNSASPSIDPPPPARTAFPSSSRVGSEGFTQEWQNAVEAYRGGQPSSPTVVPWSPTNRSFAGHSSRNPSTQQTYQQHRAPYG